MNELMIFEHEELGKVRTLEENGKVLFCGKDVAEALGYEKARNALKKHCITPGAAKRGVGVQTGVKADGSPAIQIVEMTFIDEGNVYRLITHSRLPSAKRFERWVFDEVLPSIHRTGGYSITGDFDQQEFNARMMKAIAELTELVMELKNGGYTNNTAIQNGSSSVRDMLVNNAIARVEHRNKRHEVEKLPNEVYAKAIRMLADGVSYREISAMLYEFGYRISKSAIGRFRQTIEIISVYKDRIEVLFKNKNMSIVWHDGSVEKIIG